MYSYNWAASLYFGGVNFIKQTAAFLIEWKYRGSSLACLNKAAAFKNKSILYVESEISLIS